MAKLINRKCQGCGKISDRDEFIKITLSNGKLYINPSSKIIGRSVYVCKDVSCIKTFIKRKRLYSGLKFKNFEEISKIEEQLIKMV